MKFNRKILAELKQRNLPHIQASDMVEKKEESPEAERKFQMVAEYLKGFAKMEDGKCICCGAQQGGKNLVDGLLNARFAWGIAHGEGFCSSCGYPARAIHYIGKGEDEIVIRNLILQYHPDELSFDKQPEVEVPA